MIENSLLRKLLEFGWWRQNRDLGISRVADCLQMEGVKGYFDHEDIPGVNKWGPSFTTRRSLLQRL